MRPDRAARNRSGPFAGLPSRKTLADQSERVAAVHGKRAGDIMICFVFRPKRRVNGKLRVGRTWNGKFQLRGDAKPTVVALGVSDKQVAQEKLREMVRAIERERSGLGPSESARDAAKESVGKCVGEYIDIKRGQRCDEKYVRELELKLLRLARECDWATLRDTTATISKDGERANLGTRCRRKH